MIVFVGLGAWLLFAPEAWVPVRGEARWMPGVRALGLVMMLLFGYHTIAVVRHLIRGQRHSEDA
jgi:hypothetical protein